MENPGSLQILVELLQQGGLIITFLAVLWALGERDRRKIIKLLHNVIHLIDTNGNGDKDSIQKKGGEKL